MTGERPAESAGPVSRAGCGDATGSAAGTTAVRLPSDRRRDPDRPRVDGREPAHPLPAEAIRNLARATGTGTDAVLLAGAAALLARCTGLGRRSFALHRAGIPSRAVAVDVDESLSFRALAARLAEGPEEAVDSPGTGVALLASDAPRPGTGDELCLRLIDDAAPRVAVDYDAAVFAAATARRLVEQLATLFDGAAAAPEAPVSTLPLSSPAELHAMLVAWNDTRTDLPLPGPTLHEAVSARARRDPEGVVAVDGDRRVTRAELDAAAGRAAARFRAAGVRRGVRVGVCLHRSLDLLVAVLGVLRAGGAYVPLDPAHPSSRMRSALEGADCAFVVTGTATAGLPGSDVVPEIQLDDGSEHAPVGAGGAGPDDPCYVISTSGTTGRPKGIELRHSGVLNNLVDLGTRFGIGPGDTVLALSAPGFDMSVFEFLGLPVAGGAVVLPDPERGGDPAHWVELVRRHRITVWNSAPALLERLVEQAERTGTGLESLRLALLGGDWVGTDLPDRLRALAPGLRFVALGGATEASIHSTVHEVPASGPDPGRASIPYGVPMANQRAYLLDEHRRPVPAGVPGELHLAGAGLAIGYVADDERTAERFTDWSFGPIRHERLYRTGDRARLHPDGELELLGRIDAQVKIGGVRIEPAEVESVLLAHPAVAACAVAAPGGRLTAWVVPRPDEPVPAAEELRAHAARSLPAAFLPTAWAWPAELPLSPNGKVDRRALVSTAPDPGPAGTGDPPRDEWERRVARVWQQVLGTGPLDRDSEFHAVGGDSLAAMIIAQRLDPDLPTAELHSAPTIRELARLLRDRSTPNTSGGPDA
ncbi:non-ribosomal peptide synthetase [Saccharopolyspora sp. MS10]|uniref:non-ribosomal peptide synthetase n=1 Tax=Saccharopolyspora sp. MS10 TaxID=3385973 RepID=UPI00399FCE62